MFGTKKRTYGSKRNESGVINHKDIFRNAPETSTLFQALSANNIKKYRKDNSYLLISARNSLVPSRKRTNLKKTFEVEKPVVESTSTDTSSDLSLHVKHNSIDLFDQLKSSIKESDDPFDKLFTVDSSRIQQINPRLNITTDSSSLSSPEKTKPTLRTSDADFSDIKYNMPVKKKTKTRKKSKGLPLKATENTSHSIINHKFVIEPNEQNKSNLFDKFHIIDNIPLTCDSSLKENINTHADLSPECVQQYKHDKLCEDTQDRLIRDVQLYSPIINKKNYKNCDILKTPPTMSAPLSSTPYRKTTLLFDVRENDVSAISTPENLLQENNKIVSTQDISEQNILSQSVPKISSSANIENTSDSKYCENNLLIKSASLIELMKSNNDDELKTDLISSECKSTVGHKSTILLQNYKEPFFLGFSPKSDVNDSESPFLGFSPKSDVNDSELPFSGFPSPKSSRKSSPCLFDSSVFSNINYSNNSHQFSNKTVSNKSNNNASSDDELDNVSNKSIVSDYNLTKSSSNDHSSLFDVSKPNQSTDSMEYNLLNDSKLMKVPIVILNKMNPVNYKKFSANYLESDLPSYDSCNSFNENNSDGKEKFREKLNKHSPIKGNEDYSQVGMSNNSNECLSTLKNDFKSKSRENLQNMDEESLTFDINQSSGEKVNTPECDSGEKFNEDSLSLNSNQNSILTENNINQNPCQSSPEIMYRKDSPIVLRNKKTIYRVFSTRQRKPKCKTKKSTSYNVISQNESVKSQLKEKIIPTSDTITHKKSEIINTVANVSANGKILNELTENKTVYVTKRSTTSCKNDKSNISDEVTIIHNQLDSRNFDVSITKEISDLPDPIENISQGKRSLNASFVNNTSGAFITKRSTAAYKYDKLDVSTYSYLNTSYDSSSNPILEDSFSVSTNINNLDEERSVSRADPLRYTEEFKSRPSIVLEPGKRWERSLQILKNLNRSNMTLDTSEVSCNVTIQQNHKGRKYRESIEHLIDLQSKDYGRRNSYVDFSKTFQSTLSATRLHSVTIVEEDALQSDQSLLYNSQTSPNTSEDLLSDACNDTAINLSRLAISKVGRNSAILDEKQSDSGWPTLNARDLVLRRCNQTHPLPFDECYPDGKLQKCCKIGEGVYGEVFLYKNEDDPTNPIVMKVIPIEGTELVNGDRQKKFDEIISEVVIAMELSDLRNNEDNYTVGFNKVNCVRCVKGRYPARLIELWELYDELKGSENDCPTLFDAGQLYIVLELANGGKDLEAYKFIDAVQSYYLFFQVAFALAVAEEAFQFEHRDLHWGNVLVSNSDKKALNYKLRGESYSVPTAGVCGNIIDFTLSRITLPSAGQTIFNNLAKDPDLFVAEGDYQFDIYRLMRQKNGNLWQHFEPYTNILWLHYTLDKMITSLRYERTDTCEHSIFKSKLENLLGKILQYDSCVDFVTAEECFSISDF